MISRFAGVANALSYYYGGPAEGCPPALYIQTAPSETGAGSVTLTSAQSVLSDGTVTYPLNTNADVVVGNSTEAETVTPSAVTNPTSDVPGLGGFTATFTKIHGQGATVSSATCGLQEAINDMVRRGGGKVAVDSAWAAAGGTQGMYDAANFDSPVTVSLQDNRT